MFSTIIDRIRQSFKSEQEELLEIREITKKLKHVAIIADGNRRWAKKRGLSPLEGHKKGFEEVAPQVCKDLWDMGVHTVTIWCFSTNNWARSSKEIDNLFKTFEVFIRHMIKISNEKKVKIIHLGRKDKLPQYLIEVIVEAELVSKDYLNGVFNLCLDYSGVDEIIRALKLYLTFGNNLDNLDEASIIPFLDTANQPYPNPDLIIRTSGECRFSGFMTHQSVHSELIFSSLCFPEMNKEALTLLIKEFNTRTRNYGR